MTYKDKAEKLEAAAAAIKAAQKFISELKCSKPTCDICAKLSKLQSMLKGVSDV